MRSTRNILAQINKPPVFLHRDEKKHQIPRIAELKQEQKDRDEPDVVYFHFAEEESKAGYFAKFSNKQLDELIKKYKDILGVKNRNDLENLIKQNNKTVKIFQTILTLANGINLGYIGFVATTGVSGLQMAISIFSNFILPTIAGLLIGIPLGFFDVLSYMLFFSPKKEAVLSTLEFLVFRQKPLKERMKELKEWMNKNRLATVGHALFESSLALTSSFGMMTVLLGFINFLPFGVTVFLSLITLTLGYIYMEKFTLQSARDGLYRLIPDFLTLLKKIFLEGELAKSFQVLAQSGSTIILSTYPLNYYVGENTAAAFGWTNAVRAFGIMSATASLSRNLTVYFPQAVKHYFKTGDDLHQLIKKLESNSVPELKENKLRLALKKLNFTENDLDALPIDPTKKINTIMHKLKSDIVREKGYWSLIKQEPLCLLQSIFCLGVNVGLGALSIMNPDPWAFVYLCSSIIPTITGVKATLARQSELAACEKITTCLMPEEKSNLAKNSNSCRDKSLNSCALLFTLSMAICDLLNTMGSAPDLSNDFKLFFFIFAFYRMLGGIYFSYPRMQDTLHTQWGSFENVKDEKSLGPTFFQPNKPQESKLVTQQGARLVPTLGKINKLVADI